jgi:hypothetical protein
MVKNPYNRALPNKAAAFQKSGLVFLEIANRHRYGSLKSPVCSCVAITLPVES